MHLVGNQGPNELEGRVAATEHRSESAELSLRSLQREADGHDELNLIRATGNEVVRKQMSFACLRMQRSRRFCPRW